MSNVVSMAKSCDYLVRKAAARRRKGNYDEAMTLLSKAKDQFGLREEIEIEMARVYDELECEEEAGRAYLRVVRLNGAHKAEALFQLALSSAQRADLSRALSYYEIFRTSDQIGVSPEYVRLLGEQLRKEAERARPHSRRGRAKELVRRGVERMHAGKTVAARRALEHALKLRENAQTHTLLACCALLDGDAERAIEHGLSANRLSPSRVQTLLVLADAYALSGDEKRSLNMLYLAALRSKNIDDYLATALESAKRGQDVLTLRLTHRLLRYEPFHTRAMMLRGCAALNLGRTREAARLFGRVCVLMPENTVSEVLYKMAREGEKPSERLSLGMDVPHEEGVARAVQLVAALYMSADDLREDKDRERALCRYASWAFRSQLAGAQVATVALLVMRIMDTPAALCVLEDALTDPQVEDAFKCKVLQVIADQYGIKPYPVDIGGRLVRLAAGGTTQTRYDNELCRGIVQQAADALSGFRDAPKMLLDMWLRYLEAYGMPKRSCASVCAAALEYAYHAKCSREVSLERIAQSRLVSPRLCMYYVRRILKAQENTDHGNIPGDASGESESHQENGGDWE